jgi:hypothetical protein
MERTENRVLGNAAFSSGRAAVAGGAGWIGRTGLYKVIHPGSTRQALRRPDPSTVSHTTFV